MHPADRLPIRYSPEGEENLRGITRSRANSSCALYRMLIQELRLGFPLDQASVGVFLNGRRSWDLYHPSLDESSPLEIDLPEDADVDVDPLGYRVWGHVEFILLERGDYPLARFVCTGIREIRRDYDLN